MPKRSSKRRSVDPNVTAFKTVQRIIAASEGRMPGREPPDEPAKNPAAVALGRLGGLKGGKARAAKLSARQRAEIAKKAARARWTPAR